MTCKHRDSQSLVSSGSSISQLFDQDSWERHRSIRRYLTNVASIYECVRLRTASCLS